ncbi:MAG: thiamine-phosphate kinase, partial [Pirellulales bacterium]|nr:thiamine-phosphate kinase [Pirellulales bacterium]
MESSFVAKLISSLPPDIRLEVPAGDDAAVVRPPAMRRTVITVDMLMEGTDFLPFPATDPKAVGYKALAVNLSDLAAMGARPEVAVVAVALPIKHGRTIGDEMLEGMLPLAKQFNIAIAGGDTNSWDNLLVVSVTAIGSVEPGKAWRRDGAVPGD